MIGGGYVARDRRRDRAHLLIAGQQQKSRRAAVALDADRVEAGLRVRKLAMAMRRHGAAGVFVGINERTQRADAFQPWIELEAQFAREAEIGALAGRDDDAIEGADLLCA